MGKLKLYGLPLSHNTARVIAALNEKKLDYEFITVELGKGEHKKPEFLAINPFGQVPALEDGHLKLFDSHAINRYIANKYKESGPDLLCLADPAESAAVEVWLEVESHQFGVPAAKVIFELMFKPMFGMVTDPDAVEAESAKLAEVLDVYEDRLSKNRYLAGTEFSLADLNHLPYTYFLLKTSKADLITSRPKLKMWWDAISSRPAWKKTAAAIPI